MSVMLANRYVQAHRFADALPHFEAQLRRHPEDRATTLKLIVCYAQTGRVQEGLDLMVELLERQASAIPTLDARPDEAAVRFVVGSVERRRDVQPTDEQHAALALLHLCLEPHRALVEIDAALRVGSSLRGLDRLGVLVRAHLEELS